MHGIQVFVRFTVQRCQIPSQQSLASFLVENPSPFFTGVVAGTKDYRKRRWQSVGGKDKVAQVVSGTDVLDSASGSSGKTELVTAQSGADLVVPSGENDLDGALSEVPRCENDSDGSKFDVLCSGSSGEDVLGSAKSEVLRPDAPGEDDSGGEKFEVLRSGENE